MKIANPPKTMLAKKKAIKKSKEKSLKVARLVLKAAKNKENNKTGIAYANSFLFKEKYISKASKHTPQIVVGKIKNSSPIFMTLTFELTGAL